MIRSFKGKKKSMCWWFKNLSQFAMPCRDERMLRLCKRGEHISPKRMTQNVGNIQILY